MSTTNVTFVSSPPTLTKEEEKAKAIVTSPVSKAPNKRRKNDD